MVDHQDVSSIPKSIRAGLSRRQLLRGAAPGTAVGLGVSSKLLAQDGEDELHGREHARAFNARPIPVGVGPFAPFGIFIHHMPVTPGFPLMDINEPSNITDFNGFVGITRIRGGGTGIDTLTGATTDLAFQADMGFNQGHFIGADGLHHEGTFGFVWLDLYTGPVGSADLTQQIHDYNPHIDSNDVFWTVPVAHHSVEVDFDAARARLRVRDLEVFDDHDFANSQTSGLGLPGDLGFPYPPIKPVFPVRATVSFEVEWSGLSDSANITNAQQGFNGLFLQTGSSIHWSVRQKGFRFQADPSRSQSLFAVIGRERNGTFFSS